MGLCVSVTVCTGVRVHVVPGCRPLLLPLWPGSLQELGRDRVAPGGEAGPRPRLHRLQHRPLARPAPRPPPRSLPRSPSLFKYLKLTSDGAPVRLCS